MSGAAFSIARYKISIGFFLELNQLLADYIETLEPKLWKGFRLIAGDGSSVGLPASRQIKKHFGIFAVTSDNTHTCLANTCMLYDVLSNLVLDVIIAPCSIGEGTLMATMIDNAKFPGSIFLLDRGFGYFSTCKRLINNKLDFCIRIKSSQSGFAKMAIANPLTDFIADWTPTEGEKSTCKTYGLDSSPIKVRVTKVTLNTTEVELLVSSLFDTELVNESDMQALYAMRWGVEEGFKKMKPKMKLEQFGCKNYYGIYQEFYAHIFSMNLVSIIGNQAEEQVIENTKGRKLIYQYNWQNAFRFVRNQFVNIFHRAVFHENLSTIIQQILGSLTAIKPNRSFERQLMKKRKSRYAPCYK